MTMTISEALKQMDGIAVFAADREALAVIRSRLEVTEEMVTRALRAHRVPDHMRSSGRQAGKSYEAMKAALVAALGDGK